MEPISVNQAQFKASQDALRTLLSQFSVKLSDGKLAYEAAKILQHDNHHQLISAIKEKNEMHNPHVDELDLWTISARNNDNKLEFINSETRTPISSESALDNPVLIGDKAVLESILNTGKWQGQLCQVREVDAELLHLLSAAESLSPLDFELDNSDENGGFVIDFDRLSIEDWKDTLYVGRADANYYTWAKGQLQIWLEREKEKTKKIALTSHS